MNRNRQIDFIEEAMKNAYSGEEDLPVVSESWQSTLMDHITTECSPEDAEAETIEKEFLYFSWIAAGIAAALIIISSITYATQPDALDDDLNELYSDNTLDNMTTSMVIE